MSELIPGYMQNLLNVKKDSTSPGTQEPFDLKQGPNQRGGINGPAPHTQPGTQEATNPVEEFYRRVNERAEADMLNGNPITGAHHRALEYEIGEHRKRKELPLPGAASESFRAAADIEAQTSITKCSLPPDGWTCTRTPGHDGPCAAVPTERIGDVITKLILAARCYKDAQACGSTINMDLNASEMARCRGILESLESERDELRAWKTAITDAAIVGWTLTKENESDPRKAVNDLLCMAQEIALDPRVSDGARKLIEESQKGLNELRAEMDEAQRSVKHMKDELAFLREKLAGYDDIYKGEYWIWQDDADDRPESLVCSVVMQPDVVRRFVASEQRERRLREALEAFLMCPPDCESATHFYEESIETLCAGCGCLKQDHKLACVEDLSCRLTALESFEDELDDARKAMKADADACEKAETRVRELEDKCTIEHGLVAFHKEDKRLIKEKLDAANALVREVAEKNPLFTTAEDFDFTCSYCLRYNGAHSETCFWSRCKRHAEALGDGAGGRQS